MQKNLSQSNKIFKIERLELNMILKQTLDFSFFILIYSSVIILVNSILKNFLKRKEEWRIHLETGKTVKGEVIQASFDFPNRQIIILIMSFQNRALIQIRDKNVTKSSILKDNFIEKVIVTEPWDILNQLKRAYIIQMFEYQDFLLPFLRFLRRQTFFKFNDQSKLKISREIQNKNPKVYSAKRTVYLLKFLKKCSQYF